MLTDWKDMQFSWKAGRARLRRKLLIRKQITDLAKLKLMSYAHTHPAQVMFNAAHGERHSVTSLLA